MRCNHWQDGAYCLADTDKAYLPDPRCPLHTPAALAGRPETVPDPTLTLAALRAAKGIVWSFRETDTALNDQRAIASGKRRSNSHDYRDARAAENARRAK